MIRSSEAAAAMATSTWAATRPICSLHARVRNYAGHSSYAIPRLRNPSWEYEERQDLSTLSRSYTLPCHRVLRTRMILLAAARLQNKQMRGGIGDGLFLAPTYREGLWDRPSVFVRVRLLLQPERVQNHESMVDVCQLRRLPFAGAGDVQRGRGQSAKSLTTAGSKPTGRSRRATMPSGATV